MAARLTAAPLLTALVVTEPFKRPVVVGCVVKVTVSDVVVAVVTVPAAPRVVNVTVLLAAVASKLLPLMIRVGALMARAATLAVTDGPDADVTVATWTGAPLLPPF